MSAMNAQAKAASEIAKALPVLHCAAPVSCFGIDDDLVTDPRTYRLERVHCSCRHCDYQVGRPGDDIEDAAWNEGSTFELVPSSSLKACPGLARVNGDSRSLTKANADVSR
jgi:hypothetical protein